MSHSTAPASGDEDPLARLTELAGLWSARPRWGELQVALHMSTTDAARVARGREELSGFVAGGHPPEFLSLARQILQHDESLRDGSGRQLGRWLTELCELYNLTRRHSPHLLGHVPDVNRFVGRIDDPPLSDAACEAYAGQVRTLLGQLLADQRRAGSAVVSPADVVALRRALTGLLAAVEADPIRLTRVRSAAGAVRAVFGGVRNDDRLLELVRESRALSAPARDAVADVVARWNALSCAVVWDDGPGGIAEAEHRERVRTLAPDEATIRDFRQAVRAARDTIPAGGGDRSVPPGRGTREEGAGEEH